MKITCEVCKQEGYLQRLGNYYRVRHYDNNARANGKYAFFYHKQTQEYAEALIRKTDENFNRNCENLNGKTESSKLEQLNSVQNGNLRETSLNSSGRSLVWSRTSACHADDPGSNLGGRTTNHQPQVTL